MTKLADHIKRVYTKELENDPKKTVYDLFEWSKRDVYMEDYKTGRVLCDMKDVEFPVHFSEQSVQIVVSKYFRKNGLPKKPHHETSFRQVVHRMVDFWVAALIDEGMITEEDGKILYDELAFAMLDQRFAPNSPQWFNTGLERAYGIKGTPTGMFYYDPEKGEVVESKDSYTRTQASACFILSVEDSLMGPNSITDHYVTETRLFKGGSGVGSNFSSIRATGESLSGGGQSSGLLSFLKGLDRNAGAIKSGGTTRRAAKLVALDVDHPEIENFISWKAEEEDKVRALAKMGYDAGMDGEAYETVSGQNSNNSVVFTDEFMEKVENLDKNPDATITLKGRVDDSVNREVKVKDLWELFNQSAWEVADPAPLFRNTFNDWHTCPGGENGDVDDPNNMINSTNPCGEYAFLDNSSCNLASINILKFYDQDTNKFLVDEFLHTVTICQLVLEASVAWGQFPTREIAQRTHDFRATGLGITNLAALFLSMAIPYDSEEARALAAGIMGTLTGHSYYISSLMAKQLEPFTYYNVNKEHMLRVIRNHSRAAGALTGSFEGLSYTPPRVRHKILRDIEQEELSDALKESWTLALENGEKNGYRNAQVSVCAPTGTISFAMGADSTSIEPFFGHVTYKKLAGGGFMELTNPQLEVALKRLGYPENERKAIIDYVLRKENGFVVDGKIEGAPYLKEEHLPVFDTANKCGSGERYIAATGHVDMVAAIAPLISGAISKTVNLPGNATVQDFKDVVFSSWKKGVKGITLYRDGSKFTQPLNQQLHDADNKVELKDLNYYDLLEKAEELADFEAKVKSGELTFRDKMTGIRSGRTHPAEIGDVKLYATVNRDESGRMAEMYITTDREGTLIMGLLNSLSKTISVMLQYHIPPEQISKMLRGQKYEPYGFVNRHPYIKHCSSISDFISKVIDIETGDYSRLQVKPPSIEKEKVKESHVVKEKDLKSSYQSLSSGTLVVDSTTDEPVKKKEGERVYGKTCNNCGSDHLIEVGTCLYCQDCGDSSGCS